MPTERQLGIEEALPRTSLAARITELEGIIEVLIAGHVDVEPTIAEVTVRRTEAEIAALLMSDQELATMLEAYRDQPAAAASISRPATVRELARRSRMSAHARMADVRERMRIRRG